MGAINAARTAEVVVVGAGIVGLSAARALRAKGVDVAVFEKATAGDEQSGRNWGYVRQQARAEPELPLAIAANEIWRGLETELDADIGWRQRGNLQLIHTEADLDWYTKWAELGRRYGIPTEMLSPEQVSELLPGAAQRFRGAMYTPNDGQADPVRTMRALAADAIRCGASLNEGVTVTSLRLRRGAVVGVETSAGTIHSQHVVVAGGVWSRRLLATAGVDLPAQRIRATVAESVPLPGFAPIPATNWTNEVSFRLTERGTLVMAIAGATDIDVMPSALNHIPAFLPTLAGNLRMFRVRVGRPLVDDLLRYLPGRRFDNREAKPNPANVRRSAARVSALFPAHAPIRVARSWAGYIDGTPDSLPVISETPVGGLLIAAGFSGHGFALGPVVGEAISDLVTTGGSRRFDLNPFRLGRFAGQRRGRVEIGR